MAIASTPRPTQSIPDIGDPAPDATLQALDGEGVALATLWPAARAGLALVFLRHYGCSFCMEHALAIERRRQDFADAGLDVALVGCGSVAEAARFRDRLGLTTALYNDPERTAYHAYGLGETPAGTLVNPKVLASGIRAIARGHLPRRSSGHPLQLQGQFLIDREGIVRTAARPTLMSDIPPVAALLDEARRLP